MKVHISESFLSVLWDSMRGRVRRDYRPIKAGDRFTIFADGKIIDYDLELTAEEVKPEAPPALPPPKAD